MSAPTALPAESNIHKPRCKGGQRRPCPDFQLVSTIRVLQAWPSPWIFVQAGDGGGGGGSKPQIPHVGACTLNLAVPWGPHRPHPTAPSPSTWPLLLPFPQGNQTQGSPVLGGCSPGCRGGSVGSSPAPAPAPNSPGRDSAGMLHGHLGSLLPPRVSNLVFAEQCHQCLQQTVSSSSLSRFRNLSLLFFFFFLI